MVAHVLELGHQLVPQLLVNNRHLALWRNYEYAEEYKGFVKDGRIFKWKVQGHFVYTPAECFHWRGSFHSLSTGGGASSLPMSRTVPGSSSHFD